MSQESFHIKRRTVGVSSDSGDPVCIFIPENTVLTVTDGPMDGKSMVNVKWGETTATIFVEDLKNARKAVSRKVGR